MSVTTLKDISDKLGISVSTVSRVVHNKMYVKKETKEKVLLALQQYNYIPNEIARSLKAHASMTIGIVIPDICEIFFGGIIKGIDSVVSPYGYTIIIADTNESKENEKKCLEMLYQKRIDALVLATVDLTGESVKRFLGTSIPVIFIDNIPKLNNIVSITINNRIASKIAVNQLIKAGHTEIATIIGSIEETTGFERMQGYKEALEQADLPFYEQLIQFGKYKEQDGFQCMDRLLKRRSKRSFTAVYVTSEMMTFGAIKAIQKHGLKIPRDISLVGFDVHDKAGLLCPKIATIRQRENLIGKKTGEMLMEGLKNGKGRNMQLWDLKKILLQPEFICGESILQKT